MKGFLIKTVVNGIALWVAALAVQGISLGEEAPELSTRLLTILLVALVFGVINAVVKPIAKFLAFPAIVLTLGLFTLIVNAAMLWLTSWFSGKVGLDFSVDNFFWTSVIGGIVITLVSMILNVLVPDTD
ncbi:MAG TPA: phage holin family protein [Intrasporangiaceae bacterium]|nr:phage holin family protein [Intrasporangiaceae bacterium]